MYEILLDSEVFDALNDSEAPGVSDNFTGCNYEGGAEAETPAMSESEERRRRMRYIPAVPQFIDRVELGVGIYIHMMDGLFD